MQAVQYLKRIFPVRHLAFALLFICVIGSMTSSRVAAVSVTDHVVINEIMPSSVSGTTRWVELYNPTNVPVDMSGWRIQRNTSTFGPVFASGTIIGPRQFYILESTTDTLPQTSILHVQLWTGTTASTSIDDVAYSGVNIGQSYGRTVDAGDSFTVFDSPTRGAPNAPPPTPQNLALSDGTTSQACGTSTHSILKPIWDGVDGASSYNYRVILPDNTIYGPVNVSDASAVTRLLNDDGLSQFSVQAVGPTGLTSDWSMPCTVMYDGTPPVAVFDFPTLGTGSQHFSVIFSESVDPIEATDPANYFLNNWTTATSLTSLTGHATVSYDISSHVATITLSDGSFIMGEQQWGIRDVHDMVGNELDPNPTVAYSSVPAAPTAPDTLTATSRANNPNITWSWNASADPGEYSSGVDYYHYILKDDEDRVITSGDTVSTSVATPVSHDDTYTLYVYAVDRAGNEGAESTNSITIDTQPPTVTFNGYNGTDSTPHVSGTTDLDTSTVAVSIDGGLPELALLDGFGGWGFQEQAKLSGGMHTITITATDITGNRTNIGPVQFMIIPSPTLLPLIKPLSPVPTHPESIMPTATESAIRTGINDDMVSKEILPKVGTVKKPVSGGTIVQPSDEGWTILDLLWYWWLTLGVVLSGGGWLVSRLVNRYTK